MECIGVAIYIVGVVSRRRVWLVGVGGIYGCGCKEVYRFPRTTYPYSSCICSFLQHHPYFLFFLKMFFVLNFRDASLAGRIRTGPASFKRRRSQILYHQITLISSIMHLSCVISITCAIKKKKFFNNKKAEYAVYVQCPIAGLGVCVFSLFWHLAQSGVQTAVSATSDARYGHEIEKGIFS